MRTIPEKGNYSFEISDKLKSRIKLFAPHGGCIEPGTAIIVRSLAKAGWDYFIFRGTPRSPFKGYLHVTSTHYNEVHCLNLAKRSALAVSIHGKMGKTSVIEVGGGNLALARGLVSHLVKGGYPARSASQALSGQSPRNFINHAKRQGIQLELSEGFRRSLFFNYPRRPTPRPEPYGVFISTMVRWLKITEQSL